MPCPQLRALFLLALADFLAATTLLGTGTIPLLSAPLSVPAYAACPYGRMLTTVRGHCWDSWDLSAAGVSWGHCPGVPSSGWAPGQVCGGRRVSGRGAR